MQTRVKSEVLKRLQNVRFVPRYNLDEIEHYPIELPQMIEDVNEKLLECPFCGKDTAWIHYEFSLELFGEERSVHMFHVRCTGQTREIKKRNMQSFCCGVQTVEYPALSDDLNEIQESLDHIVACWNK